jgi:hypothetical protein
MLKKAVGMTALLSALVLAAPAMLESTASAAALPAMQGPVITGGWTNHIGQTITLNVVVRGNGQVSGNIVAGIPGMPRILMGNVDSVFSVGNSVYASGVLTLFLFEPELVGTSFIVRVTDDNAGDSHTPIFLWGDLVPDLAQDVDAREDVEDTTTTLGLERSVVNGGITVH